MKFFVAGASGAVGIPIVKELSKQGHEVAAMTRSERGTQQLQTLGATDLISERFNVREMPLTLLINRHGRIAYSHVGVVDKDFFERTIKTLLGVCSGRAGIRMIYRTYLRHAVRSPLKNPSFAVASILTPHVSFWVSTRVYFIISGNRASTEP